ncbi:MAG: DUF503 domain-containing protein [Myxococcales bacterium]|nr:DUF503 domain-containing protein [Myxococcales bacterium]
MFVCISRFTLQIPASGSLKAKRQVLRRVTDRVKARFNVSVAEVDDNDVWQRATVAMAVVGNERRHVQEQMDKILQFVEDMYVAPVASRETEVIALGDRLAGQPDGSLPIDRGERSLAEAEGMAEWDRRHELISPSPASPPARAKAPKRRRLSLEEARAKARSLRNPRDWEKP